MSRRFEPDNDRLFTWWAPWRQLRERNIGWRLDYILASPPLAEAALAHSVQREFGTSDHAPVTAVIDARPSSFDVDEAKKPVARGQLSLRL